MLTAYALFGTAWLVIWGAALIAADSDYRRGVDEGDRRLAAVSLLCTPVWPLALCALVVVGLFLAVSFVWRVALNKEEK